MTVIWFYALTTTSDDLYQVFNSTCLSTVLYKCVAHPSSTIFTLVNVQETNKTGEHSFTIRLVMQHKLMHQSLHKFCFLSKKYSLTKCRLSESFNRMDKIRWKRFSEERIKSLNKKSHKTTWISCTHFYHSIICYCSVANRV